MIKMKCRHCGKEVWNNSYHKDIEQYYITYCTTCGERCDKIDNDGGELCCICHFLEDRTWTPRKWCDKCKDSDAQR